MISRILGPEEGKKVSKLTLFLFSSISVFEDRSWHKLVFFNFLELLTLTGKITVTYFTSVCELTIIKSCIFPCILTMFTCDASRLPSLLKSFWNYFHNFVHLPIVSRSVSLSSEYLSDKLVTSFLVKCCRIKQMSLDGVPYVHESIKIRLVTVQIYIFVYKTLP